LHDRQECKHGGVFVILVRIPIFLLQKYKGGKGIPDFSLKNELE